MLDEIKDFALGGRIGEREFDVQHQAVELRFRQPEGSFMFDRILSRHHHEGIGQGARLGRRCYLTLGHGFQKRRLHLWRRSIDFVDENQRMKHRSG